jgi:hypothetical protein
MYTVPLRPRLLPARPYRKLTVSGPNADSFSSLVAGLPPGQMRI